MAASFGAETPILFYGPRAHANPGGRNDREWVYWPAWAFRVVAPEFRDRAFNVLQKAVLGMLRASRLTAAELGERLGVHPELATFVATELREQGRIHADWTVTKRGADLLEDEWEESANLAPGWVFRDPWSGNLWPFVASSLEYARTVPGETGGGYPLLDLGTTGSPWRQRASMQLPPDGQGSKPPDAREILRAAIRHKRLGRRRQHVGVHLDEDVEDVNAAGLDLNRVSGIEPEPTLVFLVLFLSVPRDGDEGDDAGGGVIWAPEVIEDAHALGLVLAESGRLYDTRKGEGLPEGVAPMPPRRDNPIKGRPGARARERMEAGRQAAAPAGG